MEPILNFMDVARYLYNKTPNMSNLKLQKMMYFAYLEYYKNCKEELFKNEFEAWVYGPVLPKLYSSFYELFTVSNEDNIKNKEIEKFLDSIIEKYGSMHAFDLVNKTHEDKAWIEARKGFKKTDPSNVKITLNIIKKFLPKSEI